MRSSGDPAARCESGWTCEVREFDDLPPDWRQRIDESVDAAPPLTDRQRERLEMLFRGGDAEAGDA